MSSHIITTKNTITNNYETSIYIDNKLSCLYIISSNYKLMDIIQMSTIFTIHDTLYNYDNRDIDYVIYFQVSNVVHHNQIIAKTIEHIKKLKPAKISDKQVNDAFESIIEIFERKIISPDHDNI